MDSFNGYIILQTHKQRKQGERKLTVNLRDEPKIWKYKVRYVGGHIMFREQAKGTLSIFSAPESKVLFESLRIRMDIPIEKIRDVRITSEKYLDPGMAMLIGVAALLVEVHHKVLMIHFEDEAGISHTPMFEFVVNSKKELETYPEEACASLTNLIVNMSKRQMTGVPEKLPGENGITILCSDCSSRNDIDAIWCQNCGKKIRDETPNRQSIVELACTFCGTKNKAQALYCKKCGKRLA